MTQVTAPEPHEPSDHSSDNPPGNPLAVISFITGLLLCIPGLGVVAIPTGILGYRRSRVAGVGSRPAIFGIALGAVNLLWWIALSVQFIGQYHAMKMATPAIKSTRQFILLVGSGNITSARALCADTIDEARLTDTAEQFQKWGALKDVRDYGGEVHSKDDVEVQVELPFETVDKIMVTHWSVATNAPQLTAYEFRDGPTTQPATQPARKP